MRSELYIDGQWVKPVKGGTCEVINPATEEVIHRIAAATAEDVDLAATAARRAFDRDGWPKLTGAQRAGYLRAIADGIRARQAEIARLEVLDNGKPFPEADWDVADAAGCFDFYAGLAEQLDNNPEEAIALPDARFTSKAVREPIGVAGAIIPWNYPLLMAAWKVAPALAAGCTVVLKPAELTSLTALELAAVADEAGLPAGVLNIVTGAGSIAGQAIIDHRQVDKLAFTGSGPVGSKIMAAAARDIKRVSLELGGKSPFVVFEDADIDKAVEWIMFGIFWNQGQVCSATSRVLVHEAIYGRLLERLIEETNRIKIGNGLDEGTLLGPLVSKRQYDQVVAAIEGARKAGATVACGGTRPQGFDRGFYLRPTVLTDVPLESDAWKEEIFGPVVCMRSFKTEEEAVELANDSRFGLAAAVMSKDDTRAERVAAAFRAGIVWINCSQPTFTEAPWGGYKESGIGRELGRWGLDNYLETKQITRFASEDPWGWYIKPEAAK
ncbi:MULTISPECIES: aldehyde dehydrogenase family protein [Rhizobium]|uniref:Aldehyde dehydrogenase family protein n=1 Tax=Rhizobium indigoferae TaxID=158891 RepID=A0ABZ1DQ76_9HYPH|nr:MULTISPECIES: aldehyde dehydrogenase family protein [Rhizobium]MBY5494152.1 aldehyde dehydrogenase family protein [Rhizobium leguminosarum]NNU55639.1 aldehyde dehydrogenase family protein [Rhizobium indigoferae]TBZ42060.1 aldehyde dehydrogenase family protein [Rhizobium leguminosarum bv. viciae]TCA11991.1 aldehyde dehydrogenase family protein [Rhizobium leguminosarum bv. viciae]TCA19074.1 aldehyde dehydrogenase family protein [Rhizobium leguminosarum bv. viciae]